MVARITPTARLSDLLAYNEKKVTQHKAELISARNFLQEKDKLSYNDKLQRFQNRNELNSRARLKMLHATLNFNPADHLSDEKLVAIADRYMGGLQLQRQPYLVYRHDDAAHPHIHIVSSLIRPDGSRVKTHHMAIRLSEPTRKAIEKEFDLLPNQHVRLASVPDIRDLQKIVSGSGIPVSQSMNQIVGAVIRDYTFSSLEEYNAILRNYNVTVETGGPNSKTRQYRGLYYVALDDHGNKISPPVMASQLTSRPTYARLEKKFRQPGARHEDNLSSIYQRIDWALYQQPETFRELVSNLQANSIEIVLHPRKGDDNHDHVYVDLRTKTAVIGQTLGQDYTAETILRNLPQGRSHAHGQTLLKGPYPPNNQVGIEGPEFSSRVPQVMSAVFESLPDPKDYRRGQHLYRGHKR
jgi:aromatic ring-cleaving dioxygenase